MAAVAAQSAHQPAQRAVPKAEPRRSAATAVPLTTAPSLIQRTCACGGRCAGCSANTSELDRIQPKLAVGAVNDPLEAEADRVAAVVMQGAPAGAPCSLHSPPPAAPAFARRSEMSPDNEAVEEELVEEPPVAALSAGALTRGGTPLAPGVRAFYEARLGRDLAAVRLHTGAEAADATDALHAYAFTLGNHVWLGAGQSSGVSLLFAHELAHVVQQTQPAAHAGMPPPGGALERAPPRVQRVRYWVAGGRYHRLDGNRVQRELNLGIGWDAEEEVIVPNAGRRTVRAAPGSRWARGVTGRADYYHANEGGKAVGVAWHDPVDESDACSGKDAGLATPRNINTSRQRDPRVRGGRLVKGTPPTQITLGELKPADTDQVAFGRDQLAAYEDGLRYAVDQANCWWQRNSGAAPPRWSLDINRMTGREIPSRYRFNPSSPGTSLPLSIGEWYGDERVRVVFNPSDIGLEVRGDLYVVEAGNGVYAHFARPADPEGILDRLGASARGQQRRAWVSEATWVQNNVVGPLKEAPVAQRLAKPGPAPVAVGLQDRAAVVRRRRQPKRLVDPFTQSRMTRWQADFDRFRERWSAQSNRQSRERLEFLSTLYDAEENTGRATRTRPPTGKALPSRQSLEVQLGGVTGGGGAGGAGRPRPWRIGLDRLGDFLDLWSSRPMRRLGSLRHRFGSTFVTVARRIASLQARFQSRFENQQRSARRGGGWAGIAIKALWNAATAIGKVVLRQTFSLMADSLAAGLRQKLARVLPFDDPQALRQQMEEGFPQLQSIEERVTAVQEEIEAEMDRVTTWFDGIMQPLEAATETVRRMGEFIRWALIVFQCGTPPGLGCLKLLLQEAARMALDAFMQWCPVRRRFAQVVYATGFFTGLPGRIGNYVAGVVEDLLPQSVRPVFDRSVFDREPPAEEFDCDAESPHGDTAVDMALADLESELGEEMFQAIIEASERFGVPTDEPVTPEHIEAIRRAVEQSRITPDMLREFSRNPPPLGAETVSFVDFIGHVVTRTRQRRMGTQRRRFGTSDYRRTLNRLRPRAWNIDPLAPEEVRRGAAVAKPIVYKQESGAGALGLVDVDIDISSLNCSDDVTVRIRFTQVTLEDEAGNAVDAGLQDTDTTMTLTPRELFVEEFCGSGEAPESGTEP